MSQTRSDIRQSVREALEAGLADVKWVKAHWRKITDAALPAGSVGTPRTREQRLDLVTSQATIDVVVILKFTGGEDIEDQSDVYASQIKPVVLTALAAHSKNYSLAETQFDAENAESDVGILTMLFEVEPIEPI